MQSKLLKFVCPVCGHMWTSRGQGKRVICPKCYEAKHGKPMGRSAEEMEKVRAARQQKPPAPPQTAPVRYTNQGDEQLTLQDVLPGTAEPGTGTGKQERPSEQTSKTIGEKITSFWNKELF